MPGLSIRALGSSLPLVLIKRIAHVRAGGGSVSYTHLARAPALYHTFADFPRENGKPPTVSPGPRYHLK